MSKRYNYIIGDIHGCYDELIKLETRIKKHADKNNAEPFIISVGDLIDRGNKSNQVVEHFIQGRKNNTHHSIMGNHELLMIEALLEFAPQNFKNIDYPDWLYTYNKNYKEKRGVSNLISWNDYRIGTKNIWISQGGYSTLSSFGCIPHEIESWKIDSYVLNFLINLPFYYQTDKFIITHALPYPEDLDFFINTPKEGFNIYQKELRDAGHSMVWNRNMPLENIHKEKAHISGHTPIARVKKNKRANALQIDTSCVFGGRLTAYCPELDEIISVKAEKDYLNYIQN